MLLFSFHTQIIKSLLTDFPPAFRSEVFDIKPQNKPYRIPNVGTEICQVPFICGYSLESALMAGRSLLAPCLYFCHLYFTHFIKFFFFLVSETNFQVLTECMFWINQLFLSIFPPIISINSFKKQTQLQVSMFSFKMWKGLTYQMVFIYKWILKCTKKQNLAVIYRNVQKKQPVFFFL